MPNVAMPEGLDTPDLECVMLDVEPLPIRLIYGLDVDERDFFYGPDSEPKLKFAQGPVAEDNAHVTLLFGIHPSETYVDDVINLLNDWDFGDIFVEDVDVFPSNVEGYDYKVVVAKVQQTANLLLARKKLETLPHTERFSFNPHITLAYIKGEADVDDWVRRMKSYFKSRVITPISLNLGLDD
jgi:2'-5' RNA ligase